ncbi:hypothetical protein IGI04_023727 [Brassica rapa subsp. trilocularis]|uniref:Uncharacterized protein n=1 Tax=Brassica rapa subsp. trilocularis TaxID=1813537 RepID=A0ABQ7M864_BRACM|nr:hypothetical protein IGI04_023727 [Brassica rapa subsp. trilocularis]
MRKLSFHLPFIEAHIQPYSTTSVLLAMKSVQNYGMIYCASSLAEIWQITKPSSFGSYIWQEPIDEIGMILSSSLCIKLMTLW